MKSDSSAVTFGYSILIALLLHLAFAYGLFYWFSLPLEKKFKTIPIVLISAETKTTLQTQNAKTNDENPEQNYLLTEGQSDFFRPQFPTTNDIISPLTSSKSRPLVPEFPDIEIPNTSQTTRTQQTRKGLEDIFGSQRNKTSSQTKEQLSIQPGVQLDKYEELLLVHLASKGLYDQYKVIMAAYGIEKIDFEITMTLFSNGAIKRASVTSPTAIERINQLAESTAYSASPYPAPPKKDAEKGFKYVLPVSYQARKQD